MKYKTNYLNAVFSIMKMNFLEYKVTLKVRFHHSTQVTLCLYAQITNVRKRMFQWVYLLVRMNLN